jgi:hypothetical protein
MSMLTNARRSAAVGILALLLAGPAVGQALAVPAPVAPVRGALYSVWYPENDYTRVVLPPAFPDEAAVDAAVSNAPAVAPNEHVSLGSVGVEGSGWEHELSLSRITISPGGELRLADRADAGLVVLESGWLALTERRGPARVTRGPALPLLAPQAALETVTLSAGDRLSFEPAATIVLANRGEQPASLLLASVATVDAGM